MADTFFTMNHCDRCRTTPLKVRTCSWFTDETICMECSDKETVIKRKLREQGKSDMEGCGYVPTI